MKIVKKICGCILIVLASILSLTTFAGLSQAIFINSIEEIKKSTPHGIGYLIGTLIMGFLFILLIRFMFKSAFRLIKPGNTYVESIDDIGL